MTNAQTVSDCLFFGRRLRLERPFRRTPQRTHHARPDLFVRPRPSTVSSRFADMYTTTAAATMPASPVYSLRTYHRAWPVPDAYP